MNDKDYDMSKTIDDILLEELIVKAQHKDLEAFEILYNISINIFRSEAAKYFKSGYDIDDALQETYVQIYKNLPSLNNPLTFFGWGKTIVRHTCINIIAHRDRKSGLDDYKPMVSDENIQGMEDLPAQEYRREFNPEADMEAKTAQELIRDILNDIPEKQRVCLVMWNDDKSYREIGEILGISEGTAKSRVHLAKQKVYEKVVELEKKQGIKLFSMAPISFFLWLFTVYDQKADSMTWPARTLPFSNIKKILGGAEIKKGVRFKGKGSVITGISGSGVMPLTIGIGIGLGLIVVAGAAYFLGKDHLGGQDKIPDYLEEVAEDGHYHDWEIIYKKEHYSTIMENIWIVDQEAYDEEIFIDKPIYDIYTINICKICGEEYTDMNDAADHMEMHADDEGEHDYLTVQRAWRIGTEKEKENTIHHEVEGHEEQAVVLDEYEESSITGYKCKICELFVQEKDQTDAE